MRTITPPSKRKGVATIEIQKFPVPKSWAADHPDRDRETFFLIVEGENIGVFHKEDLAQGIIDELGRLKIHPSRRGVC